MSVLRTCAQRIPGLVPGIFFSLIVQSVAAGTPLDLATELFAEGNWSAARTESRRVDVPRARLLEAVSSLRMRPGQDQAREQLAAIRCDTSIDLETRCMAAYELGLAEWRADSLSAALDDLKFAYLNTRDTPLFWRSGCSLFFLLKAEKSLRRQEPDIWQSLQSCRDIWPLEVWRECRPRKEAGTSLAARPGKWLVRFYRAQISPAIGSRCDLHPSCSEYFRQASLAHGLLGVAMMADRFVREPSVVSAAEHPVTMPDGHVRYADPLSDHDAWMRGKK